jgi:hypothetical protein
MLKNEKKKKKKKKNMKKNRSILFFSILFYDDITVYIHTLCKKVNLYKIIINFKDFLSAVVEEVE